MLFNQVRDVTILKYMDIKKHQTPENEREEDDDDPEKIMEKVRNFNVAKELR